MKSLDKKYLYKIQQNRPPYLFVDKILNLIPGKKCSSVFKLKKSLWFFKVHWKNNPNMPGFLQLESITQTCAIALLSKKSIKSKFIYLLSVDSAFFYKMVKPNDLMSIETKILRIKSGIAICEGKCKVDGKIVSKANFKLLIPDNFMKK
jgi:3-hydroxyacyl-[acyl-carrier-protein] dehydratase